MPPSSSRLPLLAASAALLLTLAFYARRTSKPRAKKIVVFVLGGPGAGKGTQCDKIIEEYPQFRFYSAGDLLRAERKSGSALAKLINDR